MEAAVDGKLFHSVWVGWGLFHNESWTLGAVKEEFVHEMASKSVAPGGQLAIEGYEPDLRGMFNSAAAITKVARNMPRECCRQQ